jgi:hypothetical protein
MITQVKNDLKSIRARNMHAKQNGLTMISLTH